MLPGAYVDLAENKQAEVFRGGVPDDQHGKREPSVAAVRYSRWYQRNFLQQFAARARLSRTDPGQRHGLLAHSCEFLRVS